MVQVQESSTNVSDTDVLVNNLNNSLLGDQYLTHWNSLELDHWPGDDNTGSHASGNPDAPVVFQNPNLSEPQLESAQASASGFQSSLHFCGDARKSCSPLLHSTKY